MLEPIQDLVDVANGRQDSKLLHGKPGLVANDIQAVAVQILHWLQSHSRLGKRYALRLDGHPAKLALFQRVFSACPELGSLFVLTDQTLDFRQPHDSGEDAELARWVALYRPVFEESK